MKSKNKKNFTILGIAILNLVVSIIAIINFKNNIPLNLFADTVVGQMCSKYVILACPIAILVLGILQVLYRLNTINKVVTTGKRIEDAMFSVVVGIIFVVECIFMYVGMYYTNTSLVDAYSQINYIYVATAILGVIMLALYSTFPINKFQGRIGLRTKETMADEEVWRISNRFNCFTGFLASLIIVILSIFYMFYSFDWISFALAAVLCIVLVTYIPYEYAKMISRKKEEKVIE